MFPVSVNNAHITLAKASAMNRGLSHYAIQKFLPKVETKYETTSRTAQRTCYY